MTTPATPATPTYPSEEFLALAEQHPRYIHRHTGQNCARQVLRAMFVEYGATGADWAACTPAHPWPLVRGEVPNICAFGAWYHAESMANTGAVPKKAG